jgi:hypothetical protein
MQASSDPEKTRTYDHQRANLKYDQLN